MLSDQCLHFQKCVSAFNFLPLLFFLSVCISSGTMDLAAPAPVVALLHWHPPPHLFLFLSLSHLSLFLHTSVPYCPSSVTQSDHTTPATSWQERKGRLNGAPWTSSVWRASSREEQVACWWLTAGRFLSTMHHTCKVRSTFAAPSWWRGVCSRTRCLSLSCCSPTARWRWVKSSADQTFC